MFSPLSNQLRDAAAEHGRLANEADVLARDVLDLYKGPTDINQRILMNKAARVICRLNQIDVRRNPLPSFKSNRLPAEEWVNEFWQWLDEIYESREAS